MDPIDHGRLVWLPAAWSIASSRRWKGRSDTLPVNHPDLGGSPVRWPRRLAMPSSLMKVHFKPDTRLRGVWDAPAHDRAIVLTVGVRQDSAEPQRGGLQP